MPAPWLTTFTYASLFIVSFATLNLQLNEHNGPEWLRAHLFKPVHTITTNNIAKQQKSSNGKQQMTGFNGSFYLFSSEMWISKIKPFFFAMLALV